MYVCVRKSSIFSNINSCQRSKKTESLRRAKVSETPMTGQSGTKASAKTQGFSKLSIKKPTWAREKLGYGEKLRFLLVHVLETKHLAKLSWNLDVLCQILLGPRLGQAAASARYFSKLAKTWEKKNHRIISCKMGEQKKNCTAEVIDMEDGQVWRMNHPGRVEQIWWRCRQ